MIRPSAPTSIVIEFRGRFICYGCRMIGMGETMEEAYSAWLEMVSFNMRMRA